MFGVAASPRCLPAAGAEDWATAEPRAPDVPSLVHGIVPREEVFGQPDGLAMHLPPLPEPAPLPPTNDQARPVAVPVWQEPVALLRRLDDLSEQTASKPARVAGWANDVARLVRRLGLTTQENPAAASAILVELDRLADRVDALAASSGGRRVAVELQRTGFALRRWLAVWEALTPLNDRGTSAGKLRRVDTEELARCLDRLDAMLRGSEKASAWHEFLLTDALRAWLASDRSADDPLPPTLAEKLMARLTSTSLTAAQQRFLAAEPLVGLREELVRASAAPVDLAELVKRLEVYEQTGAPGVARLIAGDCMRLRLSHDESRRRLADRVEANYRNANLRVAVSEELLNRLVPDRPPEYVRVRDSVAGVPVYGRAMTSADVGMRLVPDEHRARLALEVNGQVASLTSSTSGPATVTSNSQSTYAASKPMEIGLDGIRLMPTEVRVSSRMRIRRLETTLDAIPLVRGLVRGYARSELDRRQPTMRREIRRKVADTARQQLDSEAEQQLEAVSQQLERQVVDPIVAMALQPTMIHARTTERQLTMRLRLAGEDQLGAHTPRPVAPSDSLAGVQVHESAINNVLGRLQLEGQTFTIPELSQHIAAHLDRSPPETDPDHEDVSITFASQAAVRVRLQQDRVELIFSIAELSKGPRRWKNFRVRVCYRPEMHGSDAALVADGSVELYGRRLGFGAQVALRAIFLRTFSPQRPVYLTPGQMGAGSAWSDLVVNQLTIADGWLAVAWTSSRPEIRAAMRQ